MLPSPAEQPALCVDLDGTLVATDLLWESVIALLRCQPLALLSLPLWLLRGRAHLKRRIAERVALDPSTLPFRPEVVSHIARRREEGCRTILATASDELLARLVAEHLGVFDLVVASDGERNLKGVAKLEALQRVLGGAPFDYIGDSEADVPLWKAAASAFLVAPRPGLARRLETEGLRPQVLVERGGWKPFARAIRPQQWAKNVLVFVPLIMAHEVGNVGRVTRALVCFGSFCLCASGVYLVNDLLDLDSDRLHASKRNRPLAAGEVSIPVAAGAAVVLLAAGLAFAAARLSLASAGLLALYASLATAYSLKLKRMMVVDVLALAGLYTLRILTGGVAAEVRVSSWLLAFSMFFFLSLAFVKRYTELAGLPPEAAGLARGRGYSAIDIELIRVVGPTSGFVATLVFVLYISLSPDVVQHYPDASVLYFVCPVILYWLMRIWFLAQRRLISEDPVLFALKDRTSLIAGTLVVALFTLASYLRLPTLYH
jgi:4-hydroxybenzoate polyprenyltransferase/phosphoserine phosphatase